MSRTRRALALLACTVTLLTAVPSVASAAPAATSAATSRTARHVAGNLQLFYEDVSTYSNAELVMHLDGADQVVISRQGNEDRADYWSKTRTAAARLRALGFRPLHYVQYYWMPTGGSTVSGINLAEHPDWAFCRPGSSRPSNAGRLKPGWTFLDLNEHDARAAANRYLQKLRSSGFDGFYVDRGYATYISGTPAPSGPKATTTLSNKVSGCTARPVTAGRDFASAQLALLDHWHNRKGATIVLNCCTLLERSWSKVSAATLLDGRYDRIVSESQKPLVSDRAAADQGRSSEQGGDVMAFLCADSPKVAQYGWARARLWNQRVIVNTGLAGGDGSCATARNQWGIYPVLNRLNLGKPLDREPQRTACDAKGCLTWRRYRAGTIIVNQSSQTVTTPPIAVGASSCRTLYRVDAGRRTCQELADGACVTQFARRPGPGQALIISYS